MVERILLVRIFIASPSDLIDERATAEEAILKLNKTAPRVLGLTLQPVRYESDTYLTVDIDAQAAINRQIGDKYDVFLGIMGARFGTPTGRAGSGTEEEFNRAIERNAHSSDSVQIMIYFKEVHIPRDKNALRQALQVEEFRERITTLGVYSKIFKDTSAFAQMFDIDLPAMLRDRFGSPDKPADRAIVPVQVAMQPGTSASDAIDDRDFGYLDYIELFSDSTSRLGSLATNASREMERITEKIVTRTRELQACRLSDGTVDIKRAKVITNKAAADYEEYAVGLSQYQQMLPNDVQKATASLHGALALALDFRPPSEEEKTKLAQSITALVGSLRYAKSGVVQFKDTVGKTPRATGQLNRARRHLVSVLEMLAVEFEKAEVMFGSALGAIARL
jgi:Domain of unknown function (DUF4062)